MRKGSIFCTADELLLPGLASAGDVCRALNGSGRMSSSSLPWDTKVVLSGLVLHRALLLGRLVFCCEQLKLNNTKGRRFIKFLKGSIQTKDINSESIFIGSLCYIVLKLLVRSQSE